MYSYHVHYCSLDWYVLHSFMSVSLYMFDCLTFANQASNDDATSVQGWINYIKYTFHYLVSDFDVQNSQLFSHFQEDKLHNPLWQSILTTNKTVSAKNTQHIDNKWLFSKYCRLDSDKMIRSTHCSTICHPNIAYLVTWWIGTKS